MDGFAYFNTEAQGMLACIKEIESDGKEGHTIRSLIYENTAPSENDTEGYLIMLTWCMGLPDSTMVRDAHLGRLATCIAKLESQTIITP
jgi:hypothetical protein